MARNLEIGERVFVNTNRLENPPETTGAFYSTEIVDTENRSIKVNLPEQQISEWLSAKYAHRKAGLIVIQLGDFTNEKANLDLLAKGILQNGRILYGDDSLVSYWKVRSVTELKHLFQNRFFSFSDKIALVAHGSDDGRVTIGSRLISAKKIGKIVSSAEAPPDSGWQLICAVCSSGRAGFGKTLSTFRNVNCVIGPMHTAHSSEMAQFIQSYLNWNLLAGYTTTVAAKYAKHASTGNGTFTMWKNGERQSLTYS